MENLQRKTTRSAPLPPTKIFATIIEVYNLRQTLGSRLYLVDKFIDSAPQWASDQI